MNMARMKRSTTRLRPADYDADVRHLCKHVLHIMSTTTCHEAHSQDETTDALLHGSQFSLLSRLQELLECLKQLLRIDKDWLPHQEGYSMYIRPFAFSSAHTLGISKPSRCKILYSD